MTRRLFVSVDLDGLADEVRTVQDPFEGASGLTLTDPEQAHVTLKFLGDVEPDHVTAVREALDAAVDDTGLGPFKMAVGGLGVFPSLDYISVLWVGVRSGGDELTRLHRAVEDRTTAIDFPPEDHEFTPHVTIARMEHAGSKDLVQQAVRNDDPDVGRRRVEEIRLKESVLGTDGPTYETAERFPLDG